MSQCVRVAMVLQLAVGALFPLFAAGPTDRPPESATERVGFAPEGTIRLEGSFGYLTVEGWDRPEVEMTVIKSSGGKGGRAEEIHVTMNRRSDSELVIATMVRPREGLLKVVKYPLPNRARAGVEMEYQIHVPRESRLVFQHHGGYVLVNNVAGELDGSNRSGDITLLLPEPGPYRIDAKTKVGSVSSDFGDGAHRFYLAGERLVRTDPAAARRIRLRVGWGSISIKAFHTESAAPIAPGATR